MLEAQDYTKAITTYALFWIVYFVISCYHVTYYSTPNALKFTADSRPGPPVEAFDWVACGIILIYATIILAFALFKLRDLGFGYFKSGWNYIEVISSILNITIILRGKFGFFANTTEDYFMALITVNVMLLWTYAFYWARLVAVWQKYV